MNTKKKLNDQKKNIFNDLNTLIRTLDQKENDSLSPAQKICEVAFQKFADNGYNNTSIREIALAAKVNPAMIHYYYKNKKNLYQEIMKWQIRQGFKRIFQTLITVKNEYELIYSLPEKIIEGIQENPTWIRFIRREIADGAENLKCVVKDLGEFGPLGMVKFLQQIFIQVGIIKKHQSKDFTLTTVFLSQILALLFLQPYLDIMSQTDGNLPKIRKHRCKTLQSILFENALSVNFSKGVTK